MPKRQRKNAAAVTLGRLGGLARAKTVRETIPADKRREYARHAALHRWAKVKATERVPTCEEEA